MSESMKNVLAIIAKNLQYHSSKIKDTSNVIDKFELIITNKNEFDVYIDTAKVIELDGYVERTYRVNIRRLCFILTSVAEIYYEHNENKFDFITYTIRNM